MTKFFALLLVLFLSIVGVTGDYFLKRASDRSEMNWKYIALGVILFAGTAFGWFLVYKKIKISSAGFLYGIATSLLLVLVGVVFFQEQMNIYEKIGIVFALISFLLLAKFA